MATQAYCFYCFECLSASFEDRDPLALTKVEGLWEEYQESLLSGNEPGAIEPEEPPAGADFAMEDTDETDEEEGPGRDEDAAEEDDDQSTNQPRAALLQPLAQPVPQPKLPSISRLQASTSRSQSSSASSPSTPSTLSANSSNSALTTPASSTTSISTSTSTSHHRPGYSSQLSLTSSYPLFVTWHTLARHTGHRSLRGCIGTFDAVPLPSGLQTYSLTSAFEDTRFSPIPPPLLPSLSCSLTLLADFETCATPLDWSVGTHGLRITFIYRGKRYGATYLPDVAVEQGWTKEDTLESLMRKAGWDGGGSAGGGVARRFLRVGRDRSERSDGSSGQLKPWEEVSNFTTIRYTGLKASATYREWREWRRWAEENHGRALR